MDASDNIWSKDHLFTEGSRVNQSTDDTEGRLTSFIRQNLSNADQGGRESTPEPQPLTRTNVTLHDTIWNPDPDITPTHAHQSSADKALSPPLQRFTERIKETGLMRTFDFSVSDEDSDKSFSSQDTIIIRRSLEREKTVDPDNNNKLPSPVPVRTRVRTIPIRVPCHDLRERGIPSDSKTKAEFEGSSDCRPTLRNRRESYKSSRQNALLPKQLLTDLRQLCPINLSPAHSAGDLGSSEHTTFPAEDEKSPPYLAEVLTSDHGSQDDLLSIGCDSVTPDEESVTLEAASAVPEAQGVTSPETVDNLNQPRLEMKFIDEEGDDGYDSPGGQSTGSSSNSSSNATGGECATAEMQAVKLPAGEGSEKLDTIRENPTSQDTPVTDQANENNQNVMGDNTRTRVQDAVGDKNGPRISAVGLGRRDSFKKAMGFPHGARFPGFRSINFQLRQAAPTSPLASKMTLLHQLGQPPTEDEETPMNTNLSEQSPEKKETQSSSMFVPKKGEEVTNQHCLLAERQSDLNFSRSRDQSFERPNTIVYSSCTSGISLTPGNCVNVNGSYPSPSLNDSVNTDTGDTLSHSEVAVENGGVVCVSQPEVHSVLNRNDKDFMSDPEFRSGAGNLCRTFRHQEPSECTNNSDMYATGIANHGKNSLPSAAGNTLVGTRENTSDFTAHTAPSGVYSTVVRADSDRLDIDSGITVNPVNTLIDLVNSESLGVTPNPQVIGHTRSEVKVDPEKAKCADDTEAPVKVIVKQTEPETGANLPVCSKRSSLSAVHVTAPECSTRDIDRPAYSSELGHTQSVRTAGEWTDGSLDTRDGVLSTEEGAATGRHATRPPRRVRFADPLTVISPIVPRVSSPDMGNNPTRRSNSQFTYSWEVSPSQGQDEEGADLDHIPVRPRGHLDPGARPPLEPEQIPSPGPSDLGLKSSPHRGPLDHGSRTPTGPPDLRSGPRPPPGALDLGPGPRPPWSDTRPPHSQDTAPNSSEDNRTTLGVDIRTSPVRADKTMYVKAPGESLSITSALTSGVPNWPGQNRYSEVKETDVDADLPVFREGLSERQGDGLLPGYTADRYVGKGHGYRENNRSYSEREAYGINPDSVATTVSSAQGQVAATHTLPTPVTDMDTINSQYLSMRHSNSLISASDSDTNTKYSQDADIYVQSDRAYVNVQNVGQRMYANDIKQLQTPPQTTLKAERTLNIRRETNNTVENIVQAPRPVKDEFKKNGPKATRPLSAMERLKPKVEFKPPQTTVKSTLANDVMSSKVHSSPIRQSPLPLPIDPGLPSNGAYVIPGSPGHSPVKTTDVSPPARHNAYLEQNIPVYSDQEQYLRETGRYYPTDDEKWTYKMESRKHDPERQSTELNQVSDEYLHIKKNNMGGVVPPDVYLNTQPAVEPTGSRSSREIPPSPQRKAPVREMPPSQQSTAPAREIYPSLQRKAAGEIPSSPRRTAPSREIPSSTQRRDPSPQARNSHQRQNEPMGPPSQPDSTRRIQSRPGHIGQRLGFSYHRSGSVPPEGSRSLSTADMQNDRRGSTPAVSKQLSLPPENGIKQPPQHKPPNEYIDSSKTQKVLNRMTELRLSKVKIKRRPGQSQQGPVRGQSVHQSNYPRPLTPNSVISDIHNTSASSYVTSSSMTSEDYRHDGLSPAHDILREKTPAWQAQPIAHYRPASDIPLPSYIEDPSDTIRRYPADNFPTQSIGHSVDRNSALSAENSAPPHGRHSNILTDESSGQMGTLHNENPRHVIDRSHSNAADVTSGSLSRPGPSRSSNASDISASSRGSGLYQHGRPLSDYALSGVRTSHHSLVEAPYQSRGNPTDSGDLNQQRRKFASSADIYKLLQHNRRNPFVRSDNTQY